VVLCTNTGAGDPLIRKLEAFDLVVVDEAAQAIEPSCWIPLLQGRRCVLAGDACQLAPTIMSREALDGGLGISLMERAGALHDGLLSTMLSIQYRMHHAIALWASYEMYGGRLRSAPAVASHLLRDSPSITVGSLYGFNSILWSINCAPVLVDFVLVVPDLFWLSYWLPKARVACLLCR